LEYLNAVNVADHIRAEFGPGGTEFGVGTKSFSDAKDRVNSIDLKLPPLRPILRSRVVRHLPPFVFFSVPGTSWHFKSFAFGRKKKIKLLRAGARFTALSLAHFAGQSPTKFFASIIKVQGLNDGARD
jgi:hypothetical protein